MIYVIAEMGINHDGDIKVAKDLIKGAAASGANAIKFQYRNLKRSFDNKSNQLSDEMLKSEIDKNYLSTNLIISLSKFAKKLNLDVGISFFTDLDFDDFKNHQVFDFYKIPSVEFLNTKLIEILLKTKKKIYVSTGCQTEKNIKAIIKKYSKHKTISYLHCVSNYPLSPHNSNIGYIKYFKNTYKKDIGYSSHDADWRFVLLAASFGAKVIERHITRGNRDGLDETTSSTINEFKEMIDLLHEFENASNGDGPRKLNQGEMLNLQNLGRSFYLKDNFKKGSKLNRKNLIYVSPAIGLGIKDLDLIKKKTLKRNVKKGEVVTLSMFKGIKNIGNKEKKFCSKNQVALPVRKHDVDIIRREFGIGRYEFHLSYSEVDRGLKDIKINPYEEYSIHLPDYIGPNHLIDPFGEQAIKKRSEFILNSSFDFAKKIQNITGKTCPVVGSFSVNNFSNEIFYKKISTICSLQKNNDIKLLPQWLPPIAWYFGGSVKLAVFNSTKDIKFLEKFNIPICFDTAHFLMCLNSGDVQINDDLNRLLYITDHLHISGAEGLDGEGTAINLMDRNTNLVFKKCFNLKKMKVIETWQGHLDNFYGFRQSITDLVKIQK